MHTAYQLTGVINALLEEAGREDLCVPSQQIYNATQKLRARVGNEIPTAEAREFVERYVARRLAGKASSVTTQETREALGL